MPRKRNSKGLAISIAIAILVTKESAYGESICVANIAELRDAIATWTTSESGMVSIQLQQGHYRVDNAMAETLGLFEGTTSASLQLLGGYGTGCATRALDPRNTILDGNNQDSARLTLLGIGGDLEIEGVTFTQFPSGIEARRNGTITATGRRMRFAHCRVIENKSPAGGGNAYTLRLWGVGSSTTGADISVENTLVARNINLGASLSTSSITSGIGSHIVVSGSTIATNSVDPHTAAVVLQTFPVANQQIDVVNTILWGNGSLVDPIDLDVSMAMAPAKVTYTILGTLRGTVEATDTNVLENPLFLSAKNGNFRLRAESVALDAGNDSPVGGLPATDLDGRPRRVGASVDIGAYEGGDVIFYSSMDD